MSNNRTLTDEIITLIKSYANDNPAPLACEIVKIYNDHKHVDVKTGFGVITYIRLIGNASIGDVGLFCTLDDDSHMVIAGNNQSSGGVDLSEYVKLSYLVNYAGINHNHDERYFTESEIINKLTGKVDKVMGKSLSSNDYSDVDKNKLSGIENNANNYFHPLSVQCSHFHDDRYYTESEIDVKLMNILEVVYPIGSVYISVNTINPSILFGFGTWEQINDTFLLASGTKYANGSTGGEEKHTLTVDELPVHNHREANDTIVWKDGSAKKIINSTASGSYAELNTNVNVHTHNTGGGQAHNNMPPYLVVCMWKRVM